MHDKDSHATILTTTFQVQIRNINEFCKCCYTRFLEIVNRLHLSLVTRKPVFGVCDKGRLKPACTATENSWSLEISAIASIGITLSRQRTIKALIRLRGSAPLLFAYGKNRFSHNVALFLCLYRTDYFSRNWNLRQNILLDQQQYEP